MLVFNPGCRIRKHLLEVLLHQLPVLVEHPPEVFPVRKSHCKGEPDFAGLIFRQTMHLLIVIGLQAVLRTPQKTICLRQLQADVDRQVIKHCQRIQNIQHTALLQYRLAAATDQLKGLHNELNLTNTTRAKLDIVLHALAFDLANNLFLETAQGVKRTEIQVTPVDKRV